MPYDIGPKIGIDGEAEFRKEIQNISENIKTLGSELKVVASAADAEGESIESLSKKNDILNRTISELEKRMSAQQHMLDEATQKFGEADSRTQKWQRTVNETQAEINKLTAEINKNQQAMQTMNESWEVTALKETTNTLSRLSDRMKVFQSELRAAASEMDAGGDAASSYSKQISIIGKEIRNQERQIRELAKGLEIAESEYGANSKEAAQWRTQLNNATTDLNKLKGQLAKTEKALSDLNAETDDADNALEDLGDSADSAGSKLSAMTVAMGNLISSGIQAAVSAVSNLVSSIWNLDESTEEFRQAQGRLNTAFENAGYSAETAEAAYDGFYSILGDTDRATEASQLLAQLAENEEDVATWTEIAAGVNGTFGDSLPIEGLIEAANETANVGTVTGVLADALNWVGISEDEFNEKLAQCSTESERNTLIMETLAGQYDDAAAAFERNNATLIEARENQAAMDRTLASLGGTIANIKNQLGNAFAPALQGIVGAFNSILSGEEGGGANLGAALQEFFATIGEMVPQIMQVGGQILSSIAQGIVAALPTMLTTAGQIISQLTSGILTAIPNMVAQLPTIITEFINYISGEFPTIIEEGTQMLNEFVNGIIGAIPDFVARLPELITSFVEFIASNLPQIIESGIEILMNLIEGIISAIPQLVAALPQIITAIVNGIVSLLGSIVDVGKRIVEGIWSGIKNAGSWLVGKITGWFDGIVGSVKRFLGIASPSKLFADEIGENMGLGIGEGFENSMGTVQREINRAMDGLLPSVNGNVSVTGASSTPASVDFAAAVSRALSGAVVYMDGRKVGQLITRQQNNTIRANGLVPTI